jgi:excisionase family DNA binding protein
MSDQLLTARQVAQLLAVPESWVREATRQNILPHLRLGRYRRYHQADILAWLEDQKHGHGRLASRATASLSLERDERAQ